MTEEKISHVAFTDRLGLNKLWHECIKGCMITMGTPTFIKNILVFENTLINIRDGEKLYDLVQKKKIKIERDIEIKLDKWIRKHPQESKYPPLVRDQRDLFEYHGRILLYHFMIQLLEDKGFGFYKSNVIVDDAGLDG